LAYVAPKNPFISQNATFEAKPKIVEHIFDSDETKETPDSQNVQTGES
jgi:hypothetical protein